MKKQDRSWLRIFGGGCFVNAALTGLLVGLAANFASFSIDAIVLPFLTAATISFGVSLYLVRSANLQISPMRKVVLAGLGVLLGSIMAVLGIAAFLMVPGG